FLVSWINARDDLAEIIAGSSRVAVGRKQLIFCPADRAADGFRCNTGGVEICGFERGLQKLGPISLIVNSEATVDADARSILTQEMNGEAMERTYPEEAVWGQFDTIRIDPFTAGHQFPHTLAHLPSSLVRERNG